MTLVLAVGALMQIGTPAQARDLLSKKVQTRYVIYNPYLVGTSYGDVCEAFRGAYYARPDRMWNVEAKVSPGACHLLTSGGVVMDYAYIHEIVDTFCPSDSKEVSALPGQCQCNAGFQPVRSDPMCMGECEEQRQPPVQAPTCTATAADPGARQVGRKWSNPIAATGEKTQTELDWQGTGPNALSVVRNYSNWRNMAERYPAQAGWGESWAHNWAMRVRSNGYLAQVEQEDGGASIFVREEFNSGPWLAAGSADRLDEAQDGWSYERASDGQRWRFDALGRLVEQTSRNGWRTTLAHDTDGRLASVTNAFGRALNFTYDSDGALAAIDTPDGQRIAYQSDTRLLAVSHADGSRRVYLYEKTDWPQLLTGIIDEAGNRYATYTYDDTSRKGTRTEHAGGAQRYSLSYGDDGSVTVTEPLGGQRTYQYASNAGALTVLSASGAGSGEPGEAASRVQNADGTLASETDYLGVSTAYGWDASRRLANIVRAQGKTEEQRTAIEWHAQWQLPTRITQAGRVTDYTYDERGNTLSETVTDSATGQRRTTAWSYGANGLMASSTDATGATWRYGYDSAGNLTTVTNPLGQQEGRTYDSAGRLIASTRADGSLTSYNYDSRSRVTAITRAGEVTRYSYAPTGKLASVTQAGGYTVSYRYDEAQRLTRASDNRGNAIAYTLDAAGNRVKEEVRDAAGQIASATTRVMNQLSQLQAVQGAASGSTQLQYDANGELIASTDPLNQTTRQTLDALRRPTTTTFPDNAAATRSWNALDALTALTDPKGVTTQYETNAFGEVMRETSPDIGEIRYERDAAGNVGKRTDARGAQAEYERDALGRPTRITRTGPGLAEHVTTYTWDRARAGYITQVDDPSGSTAYEHDAAGRVLKETRRIAGQTYETRYTYERGELASIGYPSGLTVYYRRDATGQFTGLDTQAPGGTAKKPKPVAPFIQNLTHTALGQPKAWNWTSGDGAARTFNADGAMTATEFASYTLDAAGRITGITQDLWATSTATGTVTSYTTPLTWTAGYDSRDRLVSFGRAGASTAYTYDANSNRLTGANTTTSDTDLDGDLDDADLTQTTAQASSIDGASNRLLGYTQTVTRTRAGKTRSVVTTPVTRQMDAAGNLTSDGLKSFEYDAANRLVKVRLMKDGEAAVVTYQHNALGQRVFTGEVQAERTLPGQDTLSSGFIAWLKSSFKWLFEKQEASASIGTAFVYGAGPIPAWALLGDYDNGSATSAGRTEYIWLPQQGGYAIPVGMYRNGRLYAIHTDHLGTPRLMTDDQAQPVWQWPYSAFGDNKPTGVLKATAKPQQALTNEPVMLRATAPAQQLDLGFPGQVRDSLLGMDHNYFRTYDRERGIYTQMDPVGMLGGLNRIGYVGANPLRYTDALGLQSSAATPLRIVIGGGLALCAANPDCQKAMQNVGNQCLSAARGVRDWLLSEGAETADKDPSTPTGQRGSPIDVKPGTNEPTTIGDRDYTGHALDRMQGRGVPPSAVEDAIQNGKSSPGNQPGTSVHTGVNGVTVVTGDRGQVITVIPK